MKLAVGTVVRSAPIAQGGELAILDWESGELERRVPIVPTNPSLDHDPNPRGSSRGCRGIAVHNGHLVAASYHTLLVFTPELASIGSISHGLMTGLHEVWAPGDGTIWAAATAINAVLRLDLESGRLLDSRWPRDDPRFQAELGLEPLPLDKDGDYRATFREQWPSGSRLHLNAVAGWEGRLIALFPSAQCIADLDRGTVLVRDPNLKGAHNLVVLPDGIALVNDTRGKAVRAYDLLGGKEVRRLDLTAYPEIRRHWRRGERSRLARVARNRFLPGTGKAAPMALMVRGLAHHAGELFVGVSPAGVLRIDWESGRLLGFRRLARSADVCVHGLAVVSER